MGKALPLCSVSVDTVDLPAVQEWEAGMSNFPLAKVTPTICGGMMAVMNQGNYANKEPLTLL